MYDINNIVSSMFEIEMVLAFSKLSLRKKSSPEERKSPAAAPVSWVTRKEKKIMSNAILPETEQIWKKYMKCESSWKGQFLNKNHIKCESSWKGKLLKRNHIKYDGSWKGQTWKHFITSNVKVPELEHFRKEITSYMIVLAKGKKFLRHATWPDSYSHTLQFLGFIVLNVFELQISDVFQSRALRLETCHVDMSICRYVDMSICRYVDMSMWFDMVTATVRNLRGLVGILFTAIFSPFCDGYGKEQRDLNSTLHHSSSRIQELSPDIHVPCCGHTGHTQYVSFFTGPSWWRYSGKLREYSAWCFQPWKTGQSLGIIIPFYLIDLFAATTYYTY